MTGPDWTELVHQAANGIRRRVLEHTLKHNGGYLSQACSSAELLATLYLHLMNIESSQAPRIPLPFPGVPGPDNPDYATGAAYNGPRGPHLDRFFFSPVHYALVLYAALIEVGRMAPEGLDQFNQDGSSVELIGAEHSPGHEVTAGSLAQCLSQAGGIAMARKLRRESGMNWVFMSDGEFQEGQTWEAIAALAFHHLDNLTVLVDANAQQCDGAMEGVGHIEPLCSRLESFGAVAVEIDGHDPARLATACQTAHPGLPLVVVCRTDPCRGMDILRSRIPKLHYVRFKSDEERVAYQALLDGFRAGGAV